MSPEELLAAGSAQEQAGEAPLAAGNLAAMRAAAAAGDDLEPVDDDVNVADGRGPGGLKLRTWRRRDR